MEPLTPNRLVATYQALLNTLAKQLAGSPLEAVNTINWSSLHHAHGQADDIPPLLLATLSEDRDDREFAFQLLHETIWHQGSVYEASVVTVPILIELARLPGVPDPTSYAFLLASLANGSHTVHAAALESPEDEEEWQAIMARAGRDLTDEITKEAAVVEATRIAVGQALEILYPYLQHPEPDVRETIAQALGCYPERAHVLLPLLEKAAAQEDDTHVWETLRNGIHKMQ